jgi:hypothetical protein
MCVKINTELKFENFLKNIEHICVYNKLSPTAKTNNSILNYVSMSYKEYIASANKRSYNFELSEDEFYEIIRNPCYICGIMNKYDKNNKLIHRNGIDRFDNEIGYIKDNCKTCCSLCNYLKRDSSYNTFMQQIKKIYEYRCIAYNRQKEYDDKIEELDRIWGNDDFDNECFDEYFNNKKSITIMIDNTIVNEDTKTIKQMSIDEKRERDRLQKQTYRQRRREEMGDEAYKQMCAIEKTKEHDNGLVKWNKHKKTEEEIKEEKRKRIALQRQQMREKLGDEEYRKMMAQKRAENRAKNK